jgi:hypothetical protein
MICSGPVCDKVMNRKELHAVIYSVERALVKYFTYALLHKRQQPRKLHTANIDPSLFPHEPVLGQI